jgi:hypothetical protein
MSSSTAKEDKRDRAPTGYIKDNKKRLNAFSKRKNGIMKKAVNLVNMTDCDILVYVASEHGNVFSYASPYLESMLKDKKKKAMVMKLMVPEKDKEDDDDDDNNKQLSK